MLNIRPATPDDSQALCDMIGLLAAHHGDSAAATPETLRRDLFGPQPWAFTIVAEAAEALLGYTTLTRGVQLQAGGRTMDMHHLFVTAQARGQGIGKALVKAALAHARAEGCAYLTVGTAPNNPQAAAFYPAAGFSRYSPEGQRFWFNLSEPPA